MKGAALFFLLPATAVAAFPFFSTFTTPKLLIAGPVLAVLLWRSRRHLRFSAPALAFAAYLALCVPAYLSAPSAHDALLHLALDLAGFAAYLVAAGRASCTRPVADAPGAGSAEHPCSAAAWIAVSGLLVCLYRLAEDLLPVPALGISALLGSSTLGNPDFVAEFAAICLPAGVYLCLHRTRNPDARHRVYPEQANLCPGIPPGPSRACEGRGFLVSLALGLAAVLSSIYVLVVSDSLTGWLAAAVAMAVLAIWFISSHVRVPAGAVPDSQGIRHPEPGPSLDGKAGRRTVSCLGNARLLATVFAVVLFALSSYALFTFARPALEARLYLYRIAASAAADDPVLGSGAGSFAGQFMGKQGDYLAQHRDHADLWTNATHAHNELLNQWVERGVLPVLALVLFAALHWRGLRGRPRADAAFIAATLAAALAAFLGSVSYMVVPARLAFFILLGLLSPRGGEEEQSVRWATVAAVGAVASVLAVVPVWHAAADWLFVQRRTAASLSLDPSNGRVQFFRGVELMELGDLDAACPLLERAVPRHPNLAVLMAAGNCRFRQHRLDEAEAWYRKALAWKPTYSLAYANLALVLDARGDRDAACRHATRAASLNPENDDVLAIHARLCPISP